MGGGGTGPEGEMGGWARVRVRERHLGVVGVRERGGWVTGLKQELVVGELRAIEWFAEGYLVTCEGCM